jgi:hypothetical protein
MTNEERIAEWYKQHPQYRTQHTFVRTVSPTGVIKGVVALVLYFGLLATIALGLIKLAIFIW